MRLRIRHTSIHHGDIQQHKKDSGFTFVELLLVLTLFIVVIVASSDIFMRGQRSQQRTLALQHLQVDVRSIISRITNDIRTGSIDFFCYRTPANQVGTCGAFIDEAGGNTILAVKDAEGLSRWYKIGLAAGQNGCANAESTPCLLVSDTAGATWERMTGEGVRIDSDKTKFFISPQSDPFVLQADNTYPSNQQPRVRIQLEAEKSIKGVSVPLELSIQTLVSTREYKR